MRKLLALSVLASSMALSPSVLFAQAGDAASGKTVTDQDIQLLRSDLRSQKKQLIAQNMPLTDAQAQKFWPVYDAYAVETTKLGDARYALIKEYAQTYDSMTDAQADSLVKSSGDLDKSTATLRETWAPKFRQVLTGKQTALFLQLDRRVALIVDLQLASMIPLVKQ